MVAEAELQHLARYARASIAHAMGGPLPERPSGGVYDEPAATFVTLRRGSRLQGCVGSLEPRELLAEDVRRHALAAAFQDERGQRLHPDDVDELSVEVSMLTPLEPMNFVDEADALAQLRPGEDGLVFEWHSYRATFLPQVWSSLPNKHDFMARLKEKAGLPANFWAEDVELARYHSEKGIDPPLRSCAIAEEVPS